MGVCMARSSSSFAYHRPARAHTDHHQHKTNTHKPGVQLEGGRRAHPARRARAGAAPARLDRPLPPQDRGRAARPDLVPGGDGLVGALPRVRDRLGAERGLLRRVRQRPREAHAGGACVRAWWVWVVVVVGTCRCPPRARTSSTTHTLTPTTISTIHIQTPTPQAGLDEAFKREVLDGENKYACDKCARKTAADRGVALRMLPPVLFVSLNRFEYDMLTAQRRKARTPTCVCACVGRVGLRGDSQQSIGLDGRTSILTKPQHDRLTLSHHQPKPTKNS